MKKLSQILPVVARILLGFLFAVGGLNGFLHFAPDPVLTAGGASFMGAMKATGYLMILLKGTELVAGLLLLSGRFVPLALTVLAPVVVNIVAFHLLLSPGNYGPLAVMLSSGIYLAWHHRATFGPVLAARPAQPRSVETTARAEHALRAA